jgi:hypothetical protein
MGSAEPGFQAPGKGQPAPEGHKALGGSHRADDPETPVFRAVETPETPVV